MTLTASLLKSTVVAALGGLLFGFDTAVIAGTTAALTTRFDLSPSGLGLTVASALVGTILGAMLAGIPGDRYGRRDSLRILSAWYGAEQRACDAERAVERFCGGRSSCTIPVTNRLCGDPAPQVGIGFLSPHGRPSSAGATWLQVRAR